MVVAMQAGGHRRIARVGASQVRAASEPHRPAGQSPQEERVRQPAAHPLLGRALAHHHRAQLRAAADLKQRHRTHVLAQTLRRHRQMTRASVRSKRWVQVRPALWAAGRAVAGVRERARARTRSLARLPSIVATP
eukprot:431386-Pleurochrysis_carterae.AAC.2